MSVDDLKIETAQRLMAEIESIDLTTATVAQIQGLIAAMLNGYPTNAMVLEAGEYLHRTRICSKPANISRMTYPPHHLACCGRANEEGAPRFYGSIGRSVPFFELNPQKGDHLVVSVWKTTDKMILNKVGFTKQSVLSLQSNRELDKIYTPSSFTEQLEELHLIISDFLAKWFVRKIGPDESNLYKVTAAIANVLLAGDVFSGLIYPTVKMFGNADNIALTTAFVDKSLQLVSLEYCQVTDNADRTFRMELLDTAVKWDESGAIEWSGRELGWNQPTFTKATFKSENGEWINIDERGQRLDPVPTNMIWKAPSPMGLAFKNSYHQSFKASSDFVVKDPSREFQIKFSVILDFETKTKFISVYIPACSFPLETARAVVNAYDQFMKMAEDNIRSLTISSQSNGKFVSWEELADSKTIHLFAEDHLDIDELGKRVTSGYTLRVESLQPMPRMGEGEAGN